MDYGKLAYLKIEDLERRVGQQQAKADGQVVKSRVRTFEINGTVTGRLDLCRLGGKGAFGIIAKCKAEAGAGTSIALGVEGSCFANAHPAKTPADVLLLGQAQLERESMLYLESDGCFVQSVDILLIGSVQAGLAPRPTSVDHNDQSTVVAESRQGHIYLYFGSGIDRLQEKGRLICSGTSCDILARTQDALALAVDACGNLWLIKAAPMQPTRYRSLGQCSGGQAALAPADSGYVLALRQQGKVTLRALDQEGAAPGQTIAVEAGQPDIQNVSFVKNTTVPVLLQQQKSGISVRLLEREKQVRSAVKIRLSAAFIRLPASGNA